MPQYKLVTVFWVLSGLHYMGGLTFLTFSFPYTLMIKTVNMTKET